MTLATTIQPQYKQDGSSLANSIHSTAHNVLHLIKNKSFPNDAYTGVAAITYDGVHTYPDAEWFQIYDGSGVVPTSRDVPSIKIERNELMPAPAHPLDGGFSSPIYVALGSYTGNKNQPTGITVRAQGYSDGTNYLLCGLFTSVQSGNIGNDGGSQAIFVVADSSATLGNVATIGIATGNSTGTDSFSSDQKVVGVDNAIGGAHLAGSAYLVRTSGVGIDTVLYGGVGSLTNKGIDLSGMSISGKGLNIPGTNGLASANAAAGFELYDQTAQAIGQGARLGLGGKYTNAGASTLFAAIGGIKEDSTTGNFGGQLAFYVRGGGSAAWTLAGFFASDGGLVLGNATGGSKGPGTINVHGALYLDGTAYTNP